MNKIIVEGLTKTLVAIKKLDNTTNMQEQIIFLLTPLKDKINFLNNKKSYQDIDSIVKLSNLVVFENAPDVQETIALNASVLEEGFKKLENQDIRRLLQVVIKDAEELYSKNKQKDNDNDNSADIISTRNL